MRSIRSVVTREILSLLAILAALLMAGMFLMQYQTEVRQSETQVGDLKQALQAEQENILLQILLGRPDDLNFYFQNLKSRFPSLQLCLDLNPRLSGATNTCEGVNEVNWPHFNIVGNRNYAVRFHADTKSGFELFLELWHSPLLLFAIFTCLLTAIYLRLRLHTLLTKPLIATQNTISQLLEGNRTTSLVAPKSVVEWHKVEDSLQRLVQYLVVLERAEYEAGQLKTARQVAHDIRSPLSLLKIAIQVYTSIPAEKRATMKAAVDRIEDIVASLSASPGDQNGLWDVHQLILEVVAEKKITAPSDIEFSLEFDGTKTEKAYLGPGQFKRIVSNVLNNSIEALAGEGRITIRVVAGPGLLLIQFLDTGNGISALQVDKVTEGLSVGKPHGQGLGLTHAREFVESWGGRLTLTSAEGIGTILTLTLRTQVEDGQQSGHSNFKSMPQIHPS